MWFLYRNSLTPNYLSPVQCQAVFTPSVWYLLFCETFVLTLLDWAECSFTLTEQQCSVISVPNSSVAVTCSQKTRLSHSPSGQTESSFLYIPFPAPTLYYWNTVKAWRKTILCLEYNCKSLPKRTNILILIHALMRSLMLCSEIEHSRVRSLPLPKGICLKKTSSHLWDYQCHPTIQFICIYNLDV